MNGLLPSPTLVRSRAWLFAALLPAAATVAASIASYEIALTELAISPMLLTPGIGTAVLDRWGRSLWPAFAAGDAIGQFIIRDRVWRTTTQLELGIVEWVGWYNHTRLHSARGDIPPAEYETLYAPNNPPTVTLQST